MPPLTPAEIDYLWVLIRPHLLVSFSRDDFDSALKNPKADSAFRVSVGVNRVEATMANSFISFNRLP